jgi:hypothetical protein
VNYQDETAERLRVACANARCVLNGPHPLHRNGQGNQWIPDGREGVQAICVVLGCVLLSHTRGNHQDKHGHLFDLPSHDEPTPSTIRGVENVEAFREAVAALGEPISVTERAPHSEHYAAMTLEPIVVIDAWGLNFNLGCVVKYLARPKGQTIADLEKALWYLQHELDRRRTGAL